VNLLWDGSLESCDVYAQDFKWDLSRKLKELGQHFHCVLGRWELYVCYPATSLQISSYQMFDAVVEKSC
jgi:hypothetical protein